MAIPLHTKIRGSLVGFVRKIRHGFKCIPVGNDCEKNFIFKKFTVFCQKGQNVPKISGTFCPFVKKILDGLCVTKGYSVLGTPYPKDHSVAGMFQPGMLHPRTFRHGTPPELSSVIDTAHYWLAVSLTLPPPH
jgi:hypothetical protein